jgi:hypothetical protein
MAGRGGGERAHGLESMRDDAFVAARARSSEREKLA